MNENDEYGSEAELGEAIRRGEARAEQVFFEEFTPVIARRLRRYLGGDDEAQHADFADSLSRVLYNVAVAIKRRGVTNLTALVLTAADNEGRDWYRKQKRQPPFTDVSTMDKGELEEALRGQADPDCDEEDAGLLERLPGARAVLREAFGRLDARRQQVLLLRARDLDFSEVNRLMAEPGKTVTDNAIVKLHARAEDELAKHALELAAGRPELVMAIEREHTRRQAARKKSIRKTTTKKEGRT